MHFNSREAKKILRNVKNKSWDELNDDDKFVARVIFTTCGQHAIEMLSLDVCQAIVKEAFHEHN